jgi:hypothetical protein
MAGNDFQFEFDDFLIDPEELDSGSEGDLWDTGQSPDLFSSGQPQDIFNTKE